jgi:hypothetical protein
MSRTSSEKFRSESELDDIRYALRYSVLPRPGLWPCSHFREYVEREVPSRVREGKDLEYVAAAVLFEAAQREEEPARKGSGLEWYPLMAAKHLLGLGTYNVDDQDAEVPDTGGLSLRKLRSAVWGDGKIVRPKISGEDPWLASAWGIRQRIAAVACGLGEDRTSLSPNGNNVKVIARHLWAMVQVVVQEPEDDLKRLVESRCAEIAAAQAQFESRYATRTAIEIDGESAGPVLVDVQKAIRSLSPNDLGPLPPVFVGRDEKLAEALSAQGAQVVAISGLPGVGKTAFARMLAEELSAQFPDGCIRINAQAYGDLPALTAVEILTSILPRLNVSTEDIEDREFLVSLLRAALSSEKVLIFLDNVADPSIVIDLAGAGDGVLLVVTSRRELPTVATQARVIPIHLEPLEPLEGLQVLLGYLGLSGQSRVDAEPSAAEALVGLCAGLPMALSIIGSKLLFHGERRLDEVVSQLSRARAAILDEKLADSDLSMTAVLDWSFDSLTQSQKEALILMVRVPLDELGEMTLRELGVAHHDIELLENENLVQRLEALGAYFFHDLVREYLRTPRLLRRSAFEVSPDLSAQLARGVVRVAEEVDALMTNLRRRKEAHNLEELGEPYLFAKDARTADDTQWLLLVKNLADLSYSMTSGTFYELAVDYGIKATLCALEMGAFELAVDSLVQVVQAIEARSSARQPINGPDEGFDAELSRVQEITQLVEINISIYLVRSDWNERCAPLLQALGDLAGRLDMQFPITLPAIQDQLIDVSGALPLAVVDTTFLSRMDLDEQTQNEPEMASFFELAELERIALSLLRANEDPGPTYTTLFQRAMEVAERLPSIDFLWSVEPPLLRWARFMEETGANPALVYDLFHEILKFYRARVHQAGHSSALIARMQLMERKYA